MSNNLTQMLSLKKNTHLTKRIIFVCLVFSFSLSQEKNLTYPDIPEDRKVLQNSEASIYQYTPDDEVAGVFLADIQLPLLTIYQRDYNVTIFLNILGYLHFF